MNDCTLNELRRSPGAIGRCCRGCVCQTSVLLNWRPASLGAPAVFRCFNRREHNILPSCCLTKRVKFKKVCTYCNGVCAYEIAYETLKMSNGPLGNIPMHKEDIPRDDFSTCTNLSLVNYVINICIYIFV